VLCFPFLTRPQAEPEGVSPTNTLPAEKLRRDDAWVTIPHITNRERDLGDCKRQKLMASIMDAMSFCLFLRLLWASRSILCAMITQRRFASSYLPFPSAKAVDHLLTRSTSILATSAGDGIAAMSSRIAVARCRYAGSVSSACTPALIDSVDHRFVMRAQKM